MPRYGVSVAVSLAVHALVVGSCIGISVLQQDDVMDIREITFIDLSEQTEEKALPEPDPATTGRHRPKPEVTSSDLQPVATGSQRQTCADHGGKVRN
jgi:hypothetical protein